MNFVIVFVHRFSIQFCSLWAGNYRERFRCMRGLDKDPWYFIPGLVTSDLAISESFQMWTLTLG